MPVQKQDVEEGMNLVKRGLKRLSKLVGPGKEIPINLIAPMLDGAKKVTDAASEISGALKVRYVELVKSKGTVYTEAGSKQFLLDGWRMEIRPTGGGYDDDLLAALMKRNDVDRADWKDKEVVWTTNKVKLEELVRLGRIKRRDLDKCKKEGSFSAISPELSDE